MLTENTFNTEKTYEYILSIQLSLNGFSFSIKTHPGNRVLAFKAIPKKISAESFIKRHFEEWIQSEEILTKPFKKTVVVINSPNFTLIPEEFYGETLKNRIPLLLFGKEDGFEIAENAISRLKARLVFAMPKGLYPAFSKHLGECEAVHPLKPVINNLPELKNTENGVALLIEEKVFYAVLFNNDTVLAANSFKLAKSDDIVYFTLTMLKQAGIHPKKTALFVSGHSEYLTAVEEMLNNIFPVCERMDLLLDFSGDETVVPFPHICSV